MHITVYGEKYHTEHAGALGGPLDVLAVLFLHAQQEGRVLRLVALVEKVWLP